MGSAWVDLASLAALGAIAPWVTLGVFVLTAKMVDNWRPSLYMLGPYGTSFLIGIFVAVGAWSACLAAFLKAFTKRLGGKVFVGFLVGAMAVLVTALILGQSTGSRPLFTIAFLVGEELLSGLIVGIEVGASSPDKALGGWLLLRASARAKRTYLGQQSRSHLNQQSEVG
jgi:hypothetical protein